MVGSVALKMVGQWSPYFGELVEVIPWWVVEALTSMGSGALTLVGSGALILAVRVVEEPLPWWVVDTHTLQ